MYAETDAINVPRLFVRNAMKNVQTVRQMRCVSNAASAVTVSAATMTFATRAASVNSAWIISASDAPRDALIVLR